MIPLTNKDIKSDKKQKVCHICKKSFWIMIKTRKKSEIIDTILANLEKLLIANAI